MATERRFGVDAWHRRADRLTALAIGKPMRVLAVAGALFVAAAPIGLTAFTALDPYEFVDPATESAKAVERLEEATGLRADGSVIVLVEASAKSSAGERRIAEVAEELESVDGVAPLSETPGLPGGTLSAPGGERTYLVAAVDAEEESSDITEGLESALGAEDDVLLGGIVVADHQIAEQSEADLRLAEALAFPLLFVLSLVFFRGLVAATLPLLVGGIAIVGGLFAMRLIHEVFPLSVLALNAVTAIGFGLAIDYSLFVVSRFREEVARGNDTEAALRTTLGTAGHAIVFSGLTVAAAMASMLLFPQRFLESMAVGGMAVALVAAMAGLFVLPAVLGLLGSKVNALSPERLQRSRRATELPDEQGRWYRFATWVMRRPVGVATATAALLLAMAFPLTKIEFTPGDASALPTGSAGAVDRAIIADFDADPTTPLLIQLDGTVGEHRAELGDYRSSLAAIEGVAAVTPAGQAGPGVVRLDLVSSRGHYSAGAKDLVREVRSVPAPMKSRVAGLAASQIDEEASVASHLPLAGAALALSTLLLLFAMTRSVLLPVKALVMNVLSLSAALGLLVLVFQDGNLSGTFGFESQGGILIGIAVLIFAAGFGLSTDYGVFSLSRIKEIYDSGHSNADSVALGLERTGRMITSAALLFAVAMGALITGSLIGVQETGFGIAAAVLIDATLVRALLVPSLMVLLGERNWWSPELFRKRPKAPEVESVPPRPEPMSVARVPAPDGAVSLSASEFEDLRQLGLSMTQAKRVISYRDANGGFRTVDELDDLPGFPRQLLGELKQRVVP